MRKHNRANLKDKAKPNILLDIMTKRLQSSEMRAKIRLAGLGLSFVDSEPKEVLYISVYKVHLDYKTETKINN
jgi:hypothetical protein